MRPRPVFLLCLALWVVEAAKILATCFLAFLLFSPKELYASGFIFQLVLSAVTIVSLVGVFRMCWWGVYTYIFVSTVGAGLALLAQPVQMFAVLFFVLLVIMLVITILPYREQLR